MRILVACEESQAVCQAFRERGHEAYSCDLIECSGGHPEWHIKGNCLPLLNGKCSFSTMDGAAHRIDGRWDMIIAFPPCTFLTNSGNRWFDAAKYGKGAQERWNKRCFAVAFFLQIAFADCRRIAIENPIGCISSYWRKPDQIVQPWMFEGQEQKSTCFWLKGLPLLIPRVTIPPPIEWKEWVCRKTGRKKRQPKWYADAFYDLSPDERARVRSKTFPGIARAMAEQWGDPQEFQISFFEED